MVALRQQVFRKSEHGTPDELAAYVERIFFDAPWAAADLPSLVYEDTGGSVAGFLGVVVRRFRLRGQPLRAAVATQLMVRPGTTGLPGLHLARAFVDGPHDLAFSDTANDAARVLWERVGGVVALPYSLFWTMPLRPARYGASHLAQGVAGRALAYLTRPVCAMIDAFHTLPPAPPGDAMEPLTISRHLPEMDQVLQAWELCPQYDAETLARLLDHLERKRHYGELEKVLVRDRRGRAIGWFVYCRNSGGVGQVVQIGCRPNDYPRILALLARHARSRRIVALAGRLDPAASAALAQRGCVFTRQGPWMLVRSNHPQVLEAICRGSGLLSRLEGEWWLGF
ncbi:MAG: hypothetical protein ACHQXA_05370 [Gemmatimonadales bacterium]